MYGGSPNKKSNVKEKGDLSIVPGDIVKFSNGAKAKVQPNGQYRIISGPDEEHMRKIRRKTGSTVDYPKISLKSAQRAFNSHYRKREGTPRGNKMARTYDLNHASPIRDDTRYRRSPNIYDYRGVDVGTKVRKAPSAKQLAALAAGRDRRKNSPHRGGSPRKKGSHNKIQTVCGFNAKTKRCSKSAEGNHNEWCHLRKSSNRCVKSTIGRARSPKNPTNVARGKALMNRLRAEGRVGRGRRKGSPKARAVQERQLSPKRRGRESKLHKVTGHYDAALGNRGSACAELVEEDCEKHPSCSYAKGKGKGSGCRRKNPPVHTIKE